MNVGVIEDALFREHDGGAGHPERPERLSAISETLRSLSFSQELVPLEIRDAMRDELLRVHDAAYVSQIEGTSGRATTVFDADTRANDRTYAAAVRAAGAAICAVEAACGDGLRSFVFCRPPGHHAERSRAMGFCFFNNVAVAAAHALDSCDLSRVAVIDWDVHHGNGTAHIFAGRSDVLYVSTHQSPHYPGTGYPDEVGVDAGAGYTVNIPLPAGSGDDDYFRVMDRVVVPIVSAYDPELVLVSAGFDVHERDPLSGMQLTHRGFMGITERLVALAEQHAQGRIVHVLEGGYDLEGLSDGVSAVLEVLCGRSSGEAGRDRAATDRVAPVVDDIVQVVLGEQRAYWSV